jgi:methylthioxylose transferase
VSLLATARAGFAGKTHSHHGFAAAKIVAMRREFWFVSLTQAVLVILLALAIASKRMPLGIPGEWEWLRVHALPSLVGLMLSGLAVAGYCGFVALGLGALAMPREAPSREAGWLAGLLGVSIAIQVLIPAGAADEYDLTKWAYVNYFGASTGYYQVARKQAVADPWRFLVEYPVWIQSQDSLHIGTHPPGLIVTQCLLLRAMERNPGLADSLVRSMPFSTAEGFRQLERMDRRPIPRTDRAALYLSSLITLLACSGTVIPLYLLARSALPPPAAWVAAAFWPLAPAANLFQPDADAAYPLVSTLALALAAWAARWAQGNRAIAFALALAFASGLVMALGTFYTLAFLPVGLIATLVFALASEVVSRRKAGLILAIGAGFLLVTVLGWSITGADPITVWTWNLKNHARFYVEYPRTYLAWLAVNPIELTIALGLPTTVWCIVGVGSARAVPRITWATIAVLLLLNLLGRNMGEVARLWMLFLPPLLLAAGAGFARLEGGPRVLALSAGLQGFQTLALQAMIQVVYPV